MDGNAELLNFVYQNSQMGVDTLAQLLEIAQDRDFKRHLAAQHRDYCGIHEAARRMLSESGQDEKGISAMDKIKTYLMVNLQTLTDKTPAHLAEMLMIGSNMGVINAVKNLKKYHEAAPANLRLMEQLLALEENNLQRLRAFL